MSDYEKARIDDLKADIDKIDAKIELRRYELRMGRIMALIGLATLVMILLLTVNLNCRLAIAEEAGCEEITEAVEIAEASGEEPPQAEPETGNTEADIRAAYPGVAAGILNAVAEQAEAYELDVWLVLAIAEQESSFRPDAVSAGGDYGLMQINAINHDWLEAELGINDWLDAGQSAKAGCYLLATYLGKGYTVTQALMAYNMGESGARRAWKSGKTESSYTQGVLAKIKKQDAGVLQ